MNEILVSGDVLGDAEIRIDLYLEQVTLSSVSRYEPQPKQERILTPGSRFAEGSWNYTIEPRLNCRRAHSLTLKRLIYLPAILWLKHTTRMNQVMWRDTTKPSDKRLLIMEI